MIKYILKKFSYTVILFITVIFISFFVLHLIPGDPITAMYGQKGPTPEQRRITEKELGLDKPLLEQFSKHLKNIFFKFDFGRSYTGTKEEVKKVFFRNFKNTFKLAFFSCLLGSLIGILFGVLAAFWEGTKKSLILEFIAILLISAPTFIIGFLLQITLGHKAGLFPISGFDSILHMILPVLTLSLVIAASVFKTTQTTMLECLRQPYITVAYAKGLSKNKIIFKHALKNALIPILAHIGLIMSFLIGGSIIIEYVYNIQGTGKLMMQAFEERNYPVIRCCIILLALVIAIWNLFLDLIYLWLDPKINKKG
ncbi:ABC-type peptide/nickel transport system permease protein [Candidatus Phytoplasma australiense]|uniref:ABC-type peptide/nickel transport system permease protein n=2 Tax=Phytoplasma australiense TaxID=59748 RepID=B1VAW8_PHYAS|nr:ABC transporter permease [Candidatus Phytoplasma australiense]AGL90574.1 Oligopeptide transport system permease protein oppB [Strawberry lethal yellows phytoplasma (CPA) str. NZSb11]CAM12091.1 ABC-type peptide/nickel transport system permease protein [Candidatus Phytoplasma australiense]